MLRIPLYENYVYDGCEKCFLEIYQKQASPEISKKARPAVVVFPGGGYSFCSDREAEPVADVYLSAGYNVFVVRYSLFPNCHEINPLIDAARAITFIRSHADEFHVDKNKIAVCGFSAGGHLAAYISTCYNDERVLKALNIKENDARPDATVLAYPVISALNNINLQTISNILDGKSDDIEALNRVSLEKRVTPETPPAYIWSTSDDGCVPIQNSLDYAHALAENKVPFEIHIFPKGGHGLSVATMETTPDWDEARRYDTPYVARWTSESIRWINSTFFDDTYQHLI